MATKTKSTNTVTVSAPRENAWDKAAVMALIEKTAKTGITVRNNWQRIGIVAIGYANIHGDVTIAQRACEAIKANKSMRFTSFVAWLENHGKLRWDEKAKQIVYQPRNDVAVEPETIMASLKGDFWWEAKAEAEPVSKYDVKEAIARILKNAKSKAKEGVEIEHSELLDNLAVLAETE